MVVSYKTVSRMCQNKSTPPCVKARTKTERKLYDSEEGSDVTFLVGSEPNICRFPGHRRVLSAKSPVFAAMFTGPMAMLQKDVSLPDVDNKGFDYLLRYIYNGEIEFQTYYTASITYEVADRFICAELMEICIKYLIRSINEENVLFVYDMARTYAAKTNRHSKNNNHEPSAPTENDLITSNQPEKEISIYNCDRLVEACLDYVDEHADDVLKQESIEDFDSDCLCDILSRDTLKVTSELIVFKTVINWANRECKRRILELNLENKKLVIADLKYNARYLVMKAQEFVEVVDSEILDKTEQIYIWSYILNSNRDNNEIPPNLIKYFTIISTKRIFVNKNDSQILKSTSSVTKNLVKRCTSKEKKKSSKEKKSLSRNNSTETAVSEKKCTGTCFAEHVFSILACIFD